MSKHTLLNLSGKINPQTVTVFKIVGRVIAELGMPYVVVPHLRPGCDVRKKSRQAI